MKICFRIIFLLSSLIITNCNHRGQEKIIIATSANMQDAMEELINSFTEKTGIKCEAVISSSGKLTAQIQAGAPFDIFISADMKYPEELSKKGLTAGAPKIYAYGKLVLWSMNDQIEPSIEILDSDQVRHIAIANPDTAPYGRAAQEVLIHYNLFKHIGSKLVFGESISQTNQFITSGAAEIGFSAKSVVLSAKNMNLGKWIEIEPGAYSPVAQGVVLIKNSNDKLRLAEKFDEFLFSTEGKDILNKFGYSLKI
jgi:molybdate transport system substrate-binding protein